MLTESKPKDSPHSQTIRTAGRLLRGAGFFAPTAPSTLAGLPVPTGRDGGAGGARCGSGRHLAAPLRTKSAFRPPHSEQHSRAQSADRHSGGMLRVDNDVVRLAAMAAHSTLDDEPQVC